MNRLNSTRALLVISLTCNTLLPLTSAQGQIPYPRGDLRTFAQITMKIGGGISGGKRGGRGKDAN